MIGKFLKPQLAASPGKNSLPTSSLDGPEWVAEPKLDGCRTQIHVENHRTSAVYSRTGLSIMGQTGLEWLSAVAWPMASAILDGEAYVGEGLLHSTSVDTRRKAGQDTQQSVTLFDVLELDGADLKGQTWEIRRKTLEGLFDGVQIDRVSLTPTSDWRTMWKAWVEELGGEGVLVKRRDSKYVPGWRSPAWQKVKVELTVDVVITGMTDKATYTKDGLRTAGGMALTYGFMKNGQLVTVGQGIKWGSRAALEPFVGRVAEVKCNGQMEGGAVRHGRLLRFRDDKPVAECVLEVA